MSLSKKNPKPTPQQTFIGLVSWISLESVWWPAGQVPGTAWVCLLGKGGSLGLSLTLAVCDGVSSGGTTTRALQGFAVHPPNVVTDNQFLKLLHKGCICTLSYNPRLGMVVVHVSCDQLSWPQALEETLQLGSQWLGKEATVIAAAAHAATSQPAVSCLCLDICW